LTEEKEEEGSEFGKGLTYCLGNFLAHEWLHRPRGDGKIKGLYPASSWFNAASDHLYEIEIPKAFPEGLKERIKEFRMEMLDLGHGRALLDDDSTWEQVDASLDECRKILMLIDEHLGVDVIKGSWE